MFVCFVFDIQIAAAAAFTYPGVECWPGIQKIALIFCEMLCSNPLKAFYLL